MERKELVRRLRALEEEIMNELNSLGFKTIFDKEKARKTNVLLGMLNDRYNKGFYDFKTKTIKEKIGLKSYDSIIRFLDNTHLLYRISSLIVIKNKLNQIKNSYTSDKKELILDIAYYEGVNRRKSFIEEYGITPLTSLKKSNPKDALKLYIYDKFMKLNNYTKEELINGILDMSKNLQEKLPQHFSYNKAYGKALGELTRGMYGLTSKEIKDNYRKNNVKIPNDNILYLMNEEHLKYRLIGLYIINNYSNMYNKNEFDLFIDKCKLVGLVSRDLFMEQQKEKPYYNLFNLNKNNHNVKVSPNALKGKYQLKEMSSSLIAEEQISLFQLSRTRIKDMSEE